MFFVSGVQREFSYIGPLNSFVFFDSLCLSVSLASDVHTIAEHLNVMRIGQIERRGGHCVKRGKIVRNVIYFPKFELFQRK